MSKGKSLEDQRSTKGRNRFADKGTNNSTEAELVWWSLAGYNPYIYLAGIHMRSLNRIDKDTWASGSFCCFMVGTLMIFLWTYLAFFTPLAVQMVWCHWILQTVSFMLRFAIILNLAECLILKRLIREKQFHIKCYQSSWNSNNKLTSDGFSNRVDCFPK